MMKSFWKPRVFAVMAAVAGLLALGLRLHLYWVGGHTIPVTTDEALTVLQALEVRAGEWPLLLSAQPYMFPLEAYWMAPLVNLLPRTALGLRVLVLIEGFVFVGLALLLLRQSGGWRDVWPGLLLALFPSVYLVMNQTAYSQPHNNSAFILALAALWFVMRLNREPSARDLWLAIVGGCLAGLAFSNAILSIALLAPLGVVAVWNVAARGRWMHLPGYAAGVAVGLIPYMAAIWKHPGAHESVTATFGWADAFARLWNPAVVRTLPVTFGFTPCLFPDSDARLDWGVWGYAAFPWAFAGLLIVVAGAALFRVEQSAARERRLRPLGTMEWALGVTLFSLLLFALSRRADASAYRYLAPVVVAFPFLFAGLHQAAPRRLRALTGGLAVALAAYNLAVSCRLPGEWRHSDFARNVVRAPDLGPALRVLREQNIRHAVASHWVAYRLGFESDGQVLCSQPQNERFPGWPVPYKAEVDAAPRVAYVLNDQVRFLKPAIFERHLREMNVEAAVVTAGHFRVYHAFRSPVYEELTRVAPGRVRVTAGERPELGFALTDDDPRTVWSSGTLQREGMWIEFAFAAPTSLDRLVLKYGSFAHDRAPALRIRVRTDQGWTTVKESVPADLDPFAWRQDRPVYGHAQQTYPLDVDGVQTVRLEVARANPRMCWTLAGVRFYSRAGTQTP